LSPQFVYNKFDELINIRNADAELVISKIDGCADIINTAQHNNCS